MNLYLGNQCNLNCQYCTQNKDGLYEADIEKFKIFLENNKKYIGDTIYVSGGEPLLYIDKWIDFLSTRFERVEITTNGIDIDKLAKILFKYKNVFAHISYHQWDENIYNDKFFSSLLKLPSKKILSIRVVVESNNDYMLKYVAYKCSLLNLKLTLLYEYSYTKDITIDYEKYRKTLEFLYTFYEKTITNFSRSTQITCEHKLTYGWDNNIYPCYIVSDMYHSFNNKFKIASWNTILNNDLLNNVRDYWENFSVKSSAKDCDNCNLCYKCPLKSVYFNSRINDIACYSNKIIHELIMSDKRNLPIETFTLFTTDECNMRCKYCFETNKPFHGNRMSIDILAKIIENINNYDDPCKDYTLDLFGGEPTLNIEFLREGIKILNNRKFNNIKVKLSTNLLFLNDDLLSIIKSYYEMLKDKFRITVSIDGLKEYHDSNRVDINGNPTYDRILSNAKKLRNNIPKIKMSAHMVLDHKHLDKAEEIFTNYIHSSKGIFDFMSCALITPDTVDSTYKSDDCKNVIKAYFDIKNKHLVCDEILNEMFSNWPISIERIKGVEKNSVSYCSAGMSSIAIAPNGEILPCHRYITNIEEYKLGNIIDINGYIRLNKNSKYLHKLKNDHLKTFNDLGMNCDICPIKGLCHMCIGGVEMSNGSININSKEKCERAIELYKAGIEIQKFEQKEKLISILKSIDEKLNLILQGQIKTSNVLLSLIGDDLNE